MKILRTIRLKLRSLWQRGEVKREIDEELHFHLEQRTAENIAAGLSSDKAAREARRRFGNLQSVREECREKRGASFGEQVLRDVRYATRQLVKNPGFTTLAIVTLAVGIGANTAMFSFLNSLLLRPLPFPRAAELVQVFRATPQLANGDFSPADFLDLQREGDKSGQFAAYQKSNATLDDYERSTPWVQITPELFGVLGVRPELGRSFRPEEARAGENNVVLISHWLWLDRFDGANNIVGRTVRSGGVTYEIVGVMPPAATDHRLFNQVGVFSPLALDGAARRDRSTHRLKVIGRRAKAVSGDQLAALLSTLGSRFASEVPAESAGTTWRSAGLPEADMSPTGRAILWMLLGLSGFVLLIACSNLANFLLARTIERSRELAVRAALGAARRQLLRPFAAEALLLAALGGTGALFVCQWTMNWLHAIIWQNGGPTFDFSLDKPVLIFAAAVSLITILFFGIAPALLTLRVQANEALKTGVRGGTHSPGQQRFSRGLIAGQVAMAMVLLAGAGFFVRGAINLIDRDYGWSSQGVIQCGISLPEEAYASNEQITTFQQQLLTQLKTAPGVRSASVSTALPFLGFRAWTHYASEGQENAPQREAQVFLNDITPDYFDVTRTRLLRGRPFAHSAALNSPKVVIINESLARAFFPQADPIGKRVAPAGAENPDWAEIVGVVADAHSADVADQPVTYQLYKPMAQNPARTFTLAVRTDGAMASAVMGILRARIAGLDARLEVRELMTADRFISRLTSQFTMIRKLLIAFAGLGLFLATLGIYGMIARTVAQRTGEIGIRMALGAQIRDVVQLILGHGIRTALIGALIGAFGAAGLSRLLAAVLPAMQINPVMVLLGAFLTLLAMAIVASWLPARRAARVDPMKALRAE